MVHERLEVLKKIYLTKLCKEKITYADCGDLAFAIEHLDTIIAFHQEAK